VKKAFLLFFLLLISIIVIGCDYLPIATTMDAQVTSTSPSTVTTSNTMTLDEEDENVSTLVSDEVVTFNETGISSSNDLVSIDGNSVSIDQAGTYYLEGSSSDTVISIDVSSNELVTLVLNDVNLTSLSGAVISVINAKKVIITLSEGSTNTLSDSSLSSSHSGVIESNDDVTINGYGTLVIHANKNNGIDADDDLTIVSGSLQITSVNNGINVNNDCLIFDGNIAITSRNDGIQVENLDNTALGNLVIENGMFTISSYGDGMSASNVIAIYDGTFTISSGVNNTNVTLVSGKGIKATNGINIMGGTFVVTSKDDGFHANSDFYISGGNLTISTNDDGIHADDTLTVSGGIINILKSYEGIESYSVVITGGEIHLIASDDGINCANGVDSSGTFPFDPRNTTSSGATLTIQGGYIYVVSSGDGLDCNGSITMSGGTVIVCGPTETMNGAIDYDSSFTLTGGTLIAVGSYGMAQNASTSSTQASVLMTLSSTTSSKLALLDSSGYLICYFEPVKNYQTIVISSASLTVGSTYQLYLGGSMSASDVSNDGVAFSGNYTLGTLSQTFTMTTKIMSVGSGSTIPRH